MALELNLVNALFWKKFSMDFFQLFVRPAVKMEVIVWVLTSVHAHQDSRGLFVSLTSMSVPLGLKCTNAHRTPHASTNQDGKPFVIKSILHLDWIFPHLRHYCECHPGFRPYQDPALEDGRVICVDENECELGTHTCHPTAKCWNTIGAYQCYCGFANDQSCSTGSVLTPIIHIEWIMMSPHLNSL